jgi:predicted metal-binding protein
MKVTFEHDAVTQGGSKRYFVEIVEIAPQLLGDYINKEHFDGLCKQGCPNYGKKWSCPPLAPGYMDYTKNWKKLFILYMQISIDQFDYIKSDYLKVKAANIILKSRADKFLRKMAMQYGNYISTGSCRLCKPCKCKIGVSCAHPTIMTYSFEALGVDVSQIVEKYFSRVLLWYKPHNLPAYTSVVSGLLTNDEITARDIQSEYIRYITK